MTAPEPTTPAEYIDAVAPLIEAELLAEGGGPGDSLHSWRCEYPEMYGPCDCLKETARDLVDHIFTSTNPAVHSAMLDALVRAGVLTEEPWRVKCLCGKMLEGSGLPLM